MATHRPPTDTPAIDPTRIERTRPLRLLRAFGLAAVALLFTSASLTGAGERVDAATVIHVAPGGNDDASGSATAPVATLRRAVQLASDGDEVVMAGGRYHESVQIYAKTVHIRGETGQQVVLDGARPIGGFVQSGTAWYSPGRTIEFQRNSGPMVTAGRPLAGHPDQVFVDGVPSLEVGTRQEIRPGTFFRDTSTDRLWIGDDPAGHLVEASDLSWALYFNRADGSTLTNVTVRRYATEARHRAAVRADADDLAITDVTIEDNAYIGLSMIGNAITVDRGRFVRNGYIGVHGDQLSRLQVRDSVIAWNNTAGFDEAHSASGLKFTRASSIVIADNEVSGNGGPGIWLDLYSEGITVRGNMVADNVRSGIQLELSSGATVVDNVTTGNREAGIWILESRSMNVWHNAAIDNRDDIYVLEGPRADVASIDVRNNIMGDSVRSPFPIMTVNDWTEQRSASQMGVNADHNVYWRRTTTTDTHLSWWARWPHPWAENTTLLQQVASTGAGRSSLDLVGQPVPVLDSTGFDYRGVATLPHGAPLSASVAASLGQAAGTMLRIGPVTPSPRHGDIAGYAHDGPELDRTASTRGLVAAVRIRN